MITVYCWISLTLTVEEDGRGCDSWFLRDRRDNLCSREAEI